MFNRLLGVLAPKSDAFGSTVKPPPTMAADFRNCRRCRGAGDEEEDESEREVEVGVVMS
jgi:hypothetical protein